MRSIVRTAGTRDCDWTHWLLSTAPVGPQGPKYRLVFGRRMATDYVDAYHQPSTAAILVLPAP
jgi:hypothetical protein